MMLLQRKKLPDEYREVKYIESTGTQYIDTGVSPFQDIIIETEAQFLDVSDRKAIFGVFDKQNINGYFQLCINPERKGFIVQYGGWNDYGIKDTDKHLFSINFSKRKFNIDSNSYTLNSIVYPNIRYSIYLFCSNDNNTLSRQSSVRIYSFKIWSSGGLIRDFIPCYRKLDNNLGLYDLTSNIFYINQGIGEFLKGADV